MESECALMKPQNLLFLFSDQHSKRALGCYGHPLVKTPNLDALAARGTRFSNAYTNSPICVPARAALATGRYVFETGYWDNGKAYEGSVPSWHHRLASLGQTTTSIGKLHFRSAQDPTGFSDSRIPMNVVGGVGDLLGCLRDGSAVLNKYRGYLQEAGAGDSTYIQYDHDITELTVRWLEDIREQAQEKPWVLFASLVCPHPPIISPQSFYDLYPLNDIDWPRQHDASDRPDHPAINDIRQFLGIPDSLPEDTVRRTMAAYFGLCSYLDNNVGKILQALERNGLSDNTRVLYTSDHGEANGDRGIWGKSNMYEESVGVPMILVGDGVPAGQVIETPVSHVDCFPTITDCVGLDRLDEDDCLRGRSLFDIAGGAEPDRIAFSEFHAAGSRTGVFMLRQGDYKYVHYVDVDYPDTLFDLSSDPDEYRNLVEEAAYREVRATFQQQLAQLCDPAFVNAQARGDQLARIAAAGGRQAVLNGGSFGYTPAPGETPVYS